MPALGELYSWTTIGRAFLAGFESDVPYTVGIVELSGLGVRMLGRIVDCNPGDLRLQLPMKAVFSVASPNITLCHWTLRRD